MEFVAKVPSGKTSGLCKKHQAARLAARGSQKMLGEAHAGVSLSSWIGITISFPPSGSNGETNGWAAGGCDNRERNNGDHRSAGRGSEPFLRLHRALESPDHSLLSKR